MLEYQCSPSQESYAQRHTAHNEIHLRCLLIVIRRLGCLQLCGCQWKAWKCVLDALGSFQSKYPLTSFRGPETEIGSRMGSVIAHLAKQFKVEVVIPRYQTVAVTKLNPSRECGQWCVGGKKGDEKLLWC